MDDAAGRYRGVFAEPQFRVLFAARSVSVVAASVRIFALSVAVYSATGSPLLGAVAFGAGFVPQAVGGLLLGAVADRARPRRLIAIGYALDAALAALLALGPPPVGWSLILVSATACLAPVFNGAASRLTADVLSGDGYVLGRALYGMSTSVAQLAGLAAGGALVAAIGARGGFAVAAGCELIAALTVRFGLPDAPPPSPAAPDRAVSGPAVRASWHGSRHLLADRTVRRLLLAQWLPMMLTVGAEALVVPYAGERRFPPGAASALLAVLPVGVLLGDVVVGRCVGPGRRERWTAPLVVLAGAPLSLLWLAPPLPVAVGLLLMSGAGLAYPLGLHRRYLDAVPEPLRGLGFSLLSTGLMTLQGIGSLIAGVIAELTSASTATALAGLATVLLAPLAHTAARTPGGRPARRRPGR